MSGSNKRLFFPVISVGFAKIGTSSFTKAQGVQSVGINTNFNLDYIFELGQVQIYASLEGTADIEISMEKVLDGTPPLYMLATNGASSATLNGRSTTGSIFGMAVFADTQDNASGTILKQLLCSGTLHTSIGYQFGVDGAFRETISLLANNKVWSTGSFTYNAFFPGNESPPNISSSGGVNRRQNLVFAVPTGSFTLDTNGQVITTKATILPPDIEGITSSGTNQQASDGSFSAYLQSINVSVDLQRESLLQLGKKTPYFRYPRFPVECRTEIETIVAEYDTVSATETGTQGNGDNLTNRTIRIRTQEGLFINMGTKNKLASVALQGGGVDGAPVTARYSYVTFSDCTVTHDQDPSGLAAS